MVANVCSWCGSRLGASAAMAASRTPPRRGVSTASTPAGIAAIAEPIRTLSARTVNSVRDGWTVAIRHLRGAWATGHSSASILREPDVLQLLVGEVARLRDV